MLTQSRRDDIVLTAAAVLLAVAIPFGVASCDKVPLLAPTGTVLTLLATSDTAALNSSLDIVATAIEQGQASSGSGTGATSSSRPGSGTPVQNGTLISFTTTIGHIEPQEARTHNGQVTVRLVTGSQSGTATITAYSGGASTNIQVKVGSAAIERVTLTATPQTLGPAGGTSVISASVENVSGAPVPGVAVSFTTDAGSLSSPTATTDQNGVATTTLTTSQKATVTANVAGKTATVVVGLNPRTGISITAPTTPVSAGVPAAFTVNVSSTANIRDVTVDFGDGTSTDLGAISGSTPVQHTYTTEGTYTVRATALDASGFAEQVATSVTILPGQPPAVTITASNNNPSVGETVIFTAQVSGATSTVLRYEWNFGANAVPPDANTTGNRATASYTATGTKIITVRVVQASGPSGDGQTAIVVKP